MTEFVSLIIIPVLILIPAHLVQMQHPEDYLPKRFYVGAGIALCWSIGFSVWRWWS